MSFKRTAPAPAPSDILREKRGQVERLARQADQAVDLVTRTISSLELINQEIDDAMSEIDAYAAELSVTRAAMARQRTGNAAIINNFSKLLETGDEDSADSPEA